MTALPELLPAEAPLAMPIQRLDGIPPAVHEVTTRPHGLLVKRMLLIALTAVLTLAASSEVRAAFSHDGLDGFDIVVLVFFVPLVGWLAFGFVAFSIGFVLLISGAHPGFAQVPVPGSPLTRRTAVLMPIHNENVDDVFARIAAMIASIVAAGGGGCIDFFVLSDSGAAHAEHEIAAWAALARDAAIPLYYRRRDHNLAGKPGNIAEWVRRFGAAYECMLVLDADSMMSGQAIVGLAAIMEARPSLGLLQSVPMINGAHTLFQRWMRFASSAYGPISSAGLLWWSGSEANFWGHNAILRTRAFAESCGLPELPGKPPFGGHILSHDMVESALLRRRGWAVHMVMVAGSYEEFPPTIIDSAIRDRRWMQGNLQHLRLLGASGLSMASRLHLLIGATAYLTSPGWLILLLVTISQVAIGGNDSLPQSSPAGVLVLTAVLLFGPKLLAMIWMMADRERRQGFGGVSVIVRSIALEAVLSMMLAPVAMVMQTKALLGLLLGIPSGWQAQNRAAQRIDVRQILPSMREHLALGLIFAGTAWIDPITALWLSPLTIGLLSAPWLISLTSSDRLGSRIAASGLFQAWPPELAAPTAANSG